MSWHTQHGVDTIDAQVVTSVRDHDTPECPRTWPNGTETVNQEGFCSTAPHYLRPLSTS